MKAESTIKREINRLHRYRRAANQPNRSDVMAAWYMETALNWVLHSGESSPLVEADQRRVRDNHPPVVLGRHVDD